MKKIEKIRIYDVYSVEELKNRIPFGAENIYDVTVSKYGYLHDVGTLIVLTRAKNPDYPEGWENLEAALNEAVEQVKECWKIASEAAYHGGF